jgi:BNR repeat-containing family member/Concanavalin A-like lectin/glucanases superfamily/PKD domain
MTSLRGALVALFCVLAWAAPAAQAQQAPLGGGAWSWFGDPRAVYAGDHGPLGTTYVGWVDLDGDIKVMSYDHSTEERTTAVLQARLNRDDHANPSILVLPPPDGRIVVFYSAHVGPEMYYRVSSAPKSVRAWEEPRTIPTNTAGGFGYTYPNPIHLDVEDRIYLFWRGGNYNPTYSVQEAGSGDWSQARNLIVVPNERPYVKYASDGQDTIHAAFTNAHPCEFGDPSQGPCPRGDVNIYHARIEDGPAPADAVISNAARSVAGPLGTPIAPTQPYEVWDQDDPAWVHDVAVDPGSGHPVIVFATFPSHGDHRYHYARWTGSAWDVENIEMPGVTSMGGSFRSQPGSVYYSGGLTLDHEDPRRVYLARQVGPDAWQVETWTTLNGGASWTSFPSSLPETERNVRPVSPRGMGDGDDDMRVLWMRGPYPGWETYQTAITATQGAVNQPPIADADLSVRSGPAPVDVNFTAQAEDVEGQVQWLWDFGDGSEPVEGANPTHRYVARGRYFPMLTVTDEDAAVSRFVDEIVVGDPAAPVTYTGGTDGHAAHGAIDAGNQETTWYFDYGPTSAYGARTPADELPGGNSLQPVSATLPGLVPGRLYHYRLVAANGTGTTQGEDRVLVAGQRLDSDEYRNAVLATPGLGAYWRLGELSGESSAGQFGAGPGSLDGRYVLGQPGAHGALGDTSAGFDGSGGEFFADGPTLGSSGSMEGWFRWRSGNVLMRDNSGSADEGWILGLGNTASLRYRVGGTTFNTGRSIGQVRDGAWHHLVATKDGEDAALFVDGALVHSGTEAESQGAGMPWRVMRNGSNNVFAAGEADEIALYNRALTAPEVKAHYDRGRALAARPLPPETPNPVPDPPAAGTGPGGGVLTPAAPAARPAGVAFVRRGRLIVRGASGTRNRLTARRRGRAWQVADAAAALRAGRGCRRLGPRKVSCPAARVKGIEMHGGDGADTLTVRGRIRALLVGGPGADRLTGGRLARFRGGAGADRQFRRP